MSVQPNGTEVHFAAQELLRTTADGGHMELVFGGWAGERLTLRLPTSDASALAEIIKGSTAPPVSL